MDFDQGTIEQGGQKDLYKLVQLRGRSGKLVALAEKARKSTDNRKLDRKIRSLCHFHVKQKKTVDSLCTCSKWNCCRLKCANENQVDNGDCTVVENFLYNKGKGMDVKTRELANMQEKYGKKKISAKRAEWHPNDVKMVKVCWDLEKRGTVGETILHLCMLHNTETHCYLAKRLLEIYPALIHDIYIGVQFYGESALHMAIANGNVDMVNFLLEKGADLTARASGKFFSPTDGAAYWGEYPLSFAACVGNEECVKLLLERGADPNLQDFHGNTAMHLMVIHRKKEMFDFLYEKCRDAESKQPRFRLDIKNKEMLTPLTLAAKLAYKEMYEHVLKKEVRVFWIYSNVAATGYPLADIDTISPTGKKNDVSALNLIVFGEEEGHVTMMDSLIVNLLNDKWKNFARSRFYVRLTLFFIYCAMFVSSMALRQSVDLCAIQNDTSELRGCKQTGPLETRTVDHCYLLRTYKNEDIARLFFEACVVVGAIIYIALAIQELCYQKCRKFLKKLWNAPSMVLLLVGCVLVLLMVIGRATCGTELGQTSNKFEDVVALLAVLFTVPHFLFFCRIITGDLWRFFVIYAIFVIGFSQAFYIPFRVSKNAVFNNGFDSIMGLFSISVGEDIYDSIDKLSTPYVQITKLLFVVYMIMVTLLLINMLIAMMGNTYTIVTQNEKEWFRQWARIVLMIEESVSPSSRRMMRRQYSQLSEKKADSRDQGTTEGDRRGDNKRKEKEEKEEDKRRVYFLRKQIGKEEMKELMRLKTANKDKLVTT